MPSISKITLPSGNTYEIKDEVARQLIAGGISFSICATPETVPYGIQFMYNGELATGQFPATQAETMTFYLVQSISSVSGDKDVYDEYVAIDRTQVSGWEKIGNTQIDISNLGDLAYKDNVILTKGSGDVVLGEGTTFTAASSAVSFAAHTTKVALGTGTTFETSVVPTKTNIKATVSNVSVGVDGTDTFVKSYPGATSKLVTGSGYIFSAQPQSKNVAEVNTNISVVANKSTWDFAIGSGDDAETLIISGGNGSDVTATNTTVNNTSVMSPDSGSNVTYATGSLASNASGATVMTGLGTANTGTAATSVHVTTQPTASLSTGAASGAGVIEVATGIASASTSVSTADEVDAITNLGAGTAAAQTITVGANDKITVPKLSDLSVSVS